MNATVQKWGNSLALRIPSSVAKDVDLRQGSPVELVVDNGRIIIKSARKRKPVLSELLKSVTKDNRHSEITWGGPAGREIW